MSIKALIGTFSWLFLNGLSFVLATSSITALRAIAYFDYAITGMIFLFIVNKYMESDFYKNLGKEGEK